MLSRWRMGLGLRKSRLWGDTLNAPTVVHMKTNIQQLKVIIAGDVVLRWTEVLTMRLVDVDDLGVGRCSRDVLPAAYCAGWNGLLGLIEKAPTVDAVVVTRCKDCKHYDMGVCLKIYSDGSVHPAAWQSRKPEDFCSYGERKAGAENG